MADAPKPKSFSAGTGYPVGYGKPPKASQFKAGQSGNPNGRPKGQPTTQQLLLEEAAKLVKIKVGDDVVQLSKHRAIVRKLYNMALEGNIAAARLILPQLGAAEAAGVSGDLEPPLSEEEIALAAKLGLVPGGGTDG